MTTENLHSAYQLLRYTKFTSSDVGITIRPLALQEIMFVGYGGSSLGQRTRWPRADGEVGACHKHRRSDRQVRREHL